MDLELFLWTYIPMIGGLILGFWIVWKLKKRRK